jgi:hypothetical protein
MYDLSENLTPILNTIWWLQKLGKDWQLSNQAALKCDTEKFKLRKLSELEVRKQYQIKISNQFAALENLNDSEDINRAWENVEENIKSSFQESLNFYEWKKHNPWFDEECFRFLEQRDQAKLQWLQHPNQSIADNLNNVRHEASRHFRNEMKECLKAKIDELETSSKFKISEICIGASGALRRVTSLEKV